MAEYLFTVTDRWTDEILCQGSKQKCADFLGCAESYIKVLVKKQGWPKTNTKYSQYKVERQVFGEAKRGGTRMNDVICCDCGLLMEKVSTKRKRCPECARKHKNRINAQRLREQRGSSPGITPILSTNSEYCKGCVYFGGIPNGTCNYIFIKGKRRPCPPGKECTEKIERKDKNENKSKT